MNEDALPPFHVKAKKDAQAGLQQARQHNEELDGVMAEIDDLLPPETKDKGISL